MSNEQNQSTEILTNLSIASIAACIAAFFFGFSGILYPLAILLGIFALRKGDPIGCIGIILGAFGSFWLFDLLYGEFDIAVAVTKSLKSMGEFLQPILAMLKIVGTVLLVGGALLVSGLILFWLYLLLKASFSEGFFGRPSFLQELIRGVCSLGALAGAIVITAYLADGKNVSIFSLLPGFMLFPLPFFLYFLLGPDKKQ